MPRDITTTVYEYHELSPEAQAKARDWFREVYAGDTSFAEFILEEAAEIAVMFGLELDTDKNGPKVLWSGFASQGDGASFEGTYRYKAGALEAVKAYAPEDKSLERIVTSLGLVQQANGCRLQARAKIRSGHYVHSRMMDIEIFDNADIGTDEPSCEHCETVREALRDFADWVYSQLQAAYEWDTSDECVAETIEANEYTFTADGKRYG